MHYRNDSGRNDIITCKVAIDPQHINFFVETREALTAHTDRNWMLLLINADSSHATGWHGYDFIINHELIDEKTTTLKKFIDQDSKTEWQTVNRLKYRANGNRMEITVPRELLAVSENSITFDFHWCDNPQDLINPISLCTHGDSAPNRRFNYRFIWNQ
jgi:hypothetical protein